MDGENSGNSYEQMDDLGGFPTIFFGNTHLHPSFCIDFVAMSTWEYNIQWVRGEHLKDFLS